MAVTSLKYEQIKKRNPLDITNISSLLCKYK
nr:MAG TPA: hypothetical protein [Caudoviricetes sp.]